MTIDYPSPGEFKNNNDKYASYFFFLYHFLDKNYSLVKSSTQTKVSIFSTKTFEQRTQLKNFVMQNGNIEKLRDIILSFDEYEVIFLKNFEKKDIENKEKLSHEMIFYCHLLIALDILITHQVIMKYMENEKAKEILIGLLNLKNIESTKELSDLLANESERIFFEIELAEYLRSEEVYKVVFSEEFLDIIDSHVENLLQETPELLNHLDHEDRRILLREYIQESYILDHEIAHHEKAVEKIMKKLRNFHFHIKTPHMPSLSFKDFKGMTNRHKRQGKDEKTHALTRMNNEDNKLFLEQYLKGKGEPSALGDPSLDDRKAYIHLLKQLNAKDKLSFLEEKLRDKKSKRERLLGHKINAFERKRSNIAGESPQIASAYHAIKDEMHGHFDAKLGLAAVHNSMSQKNNPSRKNIS